MERHSFVLPVWVFDVICGLFSAVVLHNIAIPHKVRAVATRGYTQREKRLLAEYLALKFPRDRVMQEVRLGAPLDPPAGVPQAGYIGKMLGNYRRFADALVIRSVDLILIEAKVIANPGIVSTLDLYAALLPLTPELQRYKHLPVRKMLVWAVNDPTLATIAKRSGIEVVVFTPSWILADLSAKYGDRARSIAPSFTDPAVVKIA